MHAPKQDEDPTIYEVLTDHPEASTGNSKVHFALMAAYAMLSKMEKRR